MHDFNLRKVRSFIFVAELKSFRHAAEKLYISSSALSMQIHELEDSLGVALLRRTTRSVELTKEGERFLSRSKQIIADADALFKELHDAVSLQAGRITIGCVPTLTSSILPIAMETFSKRYPGVRINILDDGSRQIEHSIHSGEVDFALGQSSTIGRDFEVIPLFEDSFVALVPNNHSLATRSQIRFSELARYPFIGLRSSDSVRGAMNKAMQESGVTITPIFELMHHYSVGRLVQAGLGITAMPATTLQMFNLSGLTSIPIVSPRITREIAIIKQKNVRLSSPAQQFLKILTKTVVNLKMGTSKPTSVSPLDQYKSAV